MYAMGTGGEADLDRCQLILKKAVKREIKRAVISFNRLMRLINEREERNRIS